MKLLNYSHPLSAKAADQLRQMVGEFEEINISVHIDFEMPVKPQLVELVTAGNAAIGDEEDVLFIPPSLSFAAAYVALGLGWRPFEPALLRMVVLKAAPGPIREFVLADVIEL